MKILIVGGGNMGRTYAKSFIDTHTVAKEDLLILEHFPEKGAFFKQLGFEQVYFEPGSFISEVDLVILAIKPQDASDLFNILTPYIKPRQLVLSIMAGVRMETIRAGLATPRIIRAMPNLPAQIGMGTTGFTADPSVDREGLLLVQNLLNTTGKSLYFEREELLDAVTAISGSGPAYVFYFMQTMIDSAQRMGFSQAEAEVMVVQTFMGAVHLFKAHNHSCQEWIDMVSSKGGTTEAAMKVFAEAGVQNSIASGVEAARKRAEELGGKQ
jgi:pyrroline-5-carboxylate reductase